MIRQNAALRLLEHTTNPTERVRIMIEARLGAQLMDELPQLIENGLCGFVSYNTPSSVFYDGDRDKPDYAKSENGLFLRLVVKDVGEVHFAGLIEQFGDKERAARIVDQILRPRLELGAFRRDDMIAARTYAHGTDLHKEAEVCACGNLMRGQVTVDLATRELPDYVREREDVRRAKIDRNHSDLNRRTPVENWLKPLIGYLLEIGVTQERIDMMLLSVLSEDNNLPSVEKVVAIVGAYNGDKKALSDTLRQRSARILRLHLDRQFDVFPTNHLVYLRKHGFSLHDGSQAMDEVYVDEIARGNVSTILQHTLLFVLARTPAPRQRRDSGGVVKGINQFFPAAFKKAMGEKRYGVAAALAQLDPGKVATAEEESRALDMAIVMGQPIRLDWNRYVMPPSASFEIPEE